MKNKSPLFLMEQLSMILVFALAAALCLQGFSLAARSSRRQESVSYAATQVQTAAEFLKSTHGDYEQAALYHGGSWNGEQWTIHYDENWTPTSHSQTGTYTLTVVPIKTDQVLMGGSHLRMMQGEDILFEIQVAWQEVASHE